jgi:hypothetical protein
MGHSAGFRHGVIADADNTISPVDLRVVAAEPGQAKDHIGAVKRPAEEEDLL